MTEDLYIILLLVGLAWWHRDWVAYALSGFALIIFALSYMEVIDSMVTPLGLILIALGCYSFFKALWDRSRKG